MSFAYIKTEVKRWFIDPETLEILRAIQGTEIHLQALAAPLMQPFIQLARTPTPIFGIRWEYEVFNEEKKVVVGFIMEDSYQIVTKTLSTHHVREMVALSYDRLAAKFDELNETTRIDVGIQEPPEAEFDSLCLAAIQFLKERLSPPGRK